MWKKDLSFFGDSDVYIFSGFIVYWAAGISGANAAPPPVHSTVDDTLQDVQHVTAHIGGASSENTESAHAVLSVRTAPPLQSVVQM